MLVGRRSRACCLTAVSFLGTVFAAAAALDPPLGKLGDSLPGLTKERREQFEAGRRVFLQIKGIEQGLGPYFNDRSCRACHHLPSPGGGGSPTEKVMIELIPAGSGVTEMAVMHQRYAVDSVAP